MQMKAWRDEVESHSGFFCTYDDWLNTNHKVLIFLTCLHGTETFLTVKASRFQPMKGSNTLRYTARA